MCNLIYFCTALRQLQRKEELQKTVKMKIYTMENDAQMLDNTAINARFQLNRSKINALEMVGEREKRAIYCLIASSLRLPFRIHYVITRK